MNKRMWLIVFFIVMMMVPINGYSQIVYQKGSLKGIKSFDINFGVDEIGNLKEGVIRNDVKKLILQSGITIDEEAKGVLNIGVQTHQNKDKYKLVVYVISISFTQFVKTFNSNILIDAITWNSTEFGLVSIKKVETLRQNIKDLVDEFIVDFLEENPKKK